MKILKNGFTHNVVINYACRMFLYYCPLLIVGMFQFQMFAMFLSQLLTGEIADLYDKEFIRKRIIFNIPFSFLSIFSAILFLQGLIFESLAINAYVASMNFIVFKRKEVRDFIKNKIKR